MQKEEKQESFLQLEEKAKDGLQRAISPRKHLEWMHVKELAMSQEAHPKKRRLRKIDREWTLWDLLCQ